MLAMRLRRVGVLQARDRDLPESLGRHVDDNNFAASPWRKAPAAPTRVTHREVSSLFASHASLTTWLALRNLAVFGDF